MKINKNKILAAGVALLIVLPLFSIMLPTAAAENETNQHAYQVCVEKNYRGVWYKFETSNITLLFPAKGTKPMFIWWYTEDNGTVYVVKFQGLIEYLIFNVDEPYYRSRFRADNSAINATLWQNCIEQRIRLRWRYMSLKYREAMNRFMGWLLGLHSPYLPFSACKWNLTKPHWVTDEDASYLEFSFVLSEVYGHPRLEFAEGNIEIRCRFYNTTVTETPDKNYPNYNYTVAAGQLKFDFIVSNWEWNADKLNDFLDWLKEWNPELNITIPTDKAGLALWINMASINIEDLASVKDEALSQPKDLVEGMSKMRGVIIGDQYYNVERDETSQDEKPIEATLRLRERFRKRIRLHFHCGKTDVPVGFLEFVPWARILYENGTTYKYVNVTASYIAAGHHLRLFICYPYFGNYTLEHDPTIGLASAPQLPTLLTPEIIAILMLATVIITIAILAYRRKKETINIIST